MAAEAQNNSEDAMVETNGYRVIVQKEAEYDRSCAHVRVRGRTRAKVS